ncbi:hypothetical protein Dalk_4547 [Desulfatibacillum aliphaticivorans]|uniref:Uncharacterized protein n=1 Tax=Desulfatibacillum aliphaticivorans TaxID=218208 RepID=B8FCR2_DESAL|nr:hypothetical protein [Desulfatibacillum aliphaticivorans]ACL06225.1 hypothetical protein Dalk_4547 [Desulfatibacillum aliphaticivorans]
MAIGIPNMSYNPNAVAQGLDRLGTKLGALGQNYQNNQRAEQALALQAEQQRGALALGQAQADLELKKFEREKWLDTDMTYGQFVMSSPTLTNAERADLKKQADYVKQETGQDLWAALGNPRQFGGMWKTITGELSNEKQFQRGQEGLENRARLSREQYAQQAEARLEQDAQQHKQTMEKTNAHYQNMENIATIRANASGGGTPKTLEAYLVQKLGPNATQEEIIQATQEFNAAKDSKPSDAQEKQLKMTGNKIKLISGAIKTIEGKYRGSGMDTGVGTIGGLLTIPPEERTRDVVLQAFSGLEEKKRNAYQILNEQAQSGKNPDAAKDLATLKKFYAEVDRLGTSLLPEDVPTNADEIDPLGIR